MTHPEEHNSRDWIKFSYTREQMRRNAFKELTYIPPLVVALVIVMLLPSPTGLAIGMFVSGITGIFMIRKREIVSSMMIVRGKPAVIIGFLWVLFAWGGAILVILAKMFNW